MKADLTAIRGEREDAMKSTEYKGFEIENFEGIGYTVFYMGDEIFFSTVEKAKKFIDSL